MAVTIIRMLFSLLAEGLVQFPRHFGRPLEGQSLRGHERVHQVARPHRRVGLFQVFALRRARHQEREAICDGAHNVQTWDNAWPVPGNNSQTGRLTSNDSNCSIIPPYFLSDSVELSLTSWNFFEQKPIFFAESHELIYTSQNEMLVHIVNLNWYYFVL